MNQLFILELLQLHLVQETAVEFHDVAEMKRTEICVKRLVDQFLVDGEKMNVVISNRKLGGAHPIQSIFFDLNAVRAPRQSEGVVVTLQNEHN